MKNLSFTNIVNPGMLQTASRFMTIPKGAAMKGIDLEIVNAASRERGFAVAPSWCLRASRSGR